MRGEVASGDQSGWVGVCEDQSGGQRGVGAHRSQREAGGCVGARVLGRGVQGQIGGGEVQRTE